MCLLIWPDGSLRNLALQLRELVLKLIHLLLCEIAFLLVIFQLLLNVLDFFLLVLIRQVSLLFYINLVPCSVIHIVCPRTRISERNILTNYLAFTPKITLVHDPFFSGHRIRELTPM